MAAAWLQLSYPYEVALSLAEPPFTRSAIARARAECNCVWAGKLAEFAHTQLHSALARVITDRVNGEGLGSEASRSCV